MNPQPLQASPYVGASQIPMDVTGVDEIAGFNGGREECVDGGAREDRKSSAMAVSRTSELTISFEGEVYVFPAVTPEKVQSIPFSNVERESCICALKLCFVLERDDCLSSSIAFQWNRVPRAISKEKKNVDSGIFFIAQAPQCCIGFTYIWAEKSCYMNSNCAS